MSTFDQPSASDLARDEVEVSFSRLPDWFRDPLKVGRIHGAGDNYRGAPRQTITCTEHPDYRHEVAPSAVVFWGREHILRDHRGIEPDKTDPWYVDPMGVTL